MNPRALEDLATSANSPGDIHCLKFLTKTLSSAGDIVGRLDPGAGNAMAPITSFFERKLRSAHFKRRAHDWSTW